MTPLDGAVLFAYLLAAALAIGGTVLLFVWAASRIVGGENRWGRFHHLAQSLIPIAGCGVFLGLFALTTTMLHVEELTVPFIATARSLLMAAACLWSIVLAWRICGLYARNRGARFAASGFMALAAIVGFAAWAAPSKQHSWVHPRMLLVFREGTACHSVTFAMPKIGLRLGSFCKNGVFNYINSFY